MIDGVSNGGLPAGLGVNIAGNPDDGLKNQFMNLLVTQLKNQDPLNPMDNTAMVEQLATFTSLEQLEGINSRLDTATGYSQSLNNSMMMNLVGKRVTVMGDGVTLEGGQPSRNLLRTNQAGIGRAEIRNADGAVVRVIDDIAVSKGFTAIEWDGKGSDGQPLPDGQYTMSVVVEGSEGPVPAVLFESGIVDTLQFDNNFQSLLVNGRLFSPGDVVEVGVGPQPAAPHAQGGGKGREYYPYGG